MPVETVNGTTYYLISYDASGRERTDDPSGKMNDKIEQQITADPPTDVFVFSHGWKGDIAGAREQYRDWIAAMLTCQADRDRAATLRPGFKPLLVGFHWPSQPWGDEELGQSGSFAPGTGDTVDSLIERYAERVANTAAARAALRTVFEAAMKEIVPDSLPPDVVAAYQVLNTEAGLGAAGVGTAPGTDREPFDPERIYQDTLLVETEVNFAGGGLFGGLLTVLRQLSFWKMKARACTVGESGGRALLKTIQRASPKSTNLHLMGHSFGCIVVSAMLNTPQGAADTLRPVHSLALVQGAMSLWSYCDVIPKAPSKAGYFRDVIDGHRVSGPIITTHTQFDTAVGRFYPIGAGLRGQVVYEPGELPTYGGLGAFGIQGRTSGVTGGPMLPPNATYAFAPGSVRNLDASAYIRNGSGASGAHNDIAHPEVAHAIWEAALTVVV